MSKFKKRTTLYLTTSQLERLQIQAEKEGVAMAEIVRRAVECYLTWNDPTYNSASHPPTRP